MASDKAEIFVTVIESHKGILYKIANLYCKKAEDRKDLVQEITFQLWKSFDNYDDQYKYSTWIYKISLNVAISFYRKNKNVPLALDESFLNVQDSGQEADKEGRSQLLQGFIAELKTLEKALMLLYLEEKSHKEIAEIVGISPSNVATKISRIKLLLKQKFSIKPS